MTERGAKHINIPLLFFTLPILTAYFKMNAINDKSSNEEALEMIKDAIAGHLEVIEEKRKVRKVA